MPYDPSTDELRQLRNELNQLRLDHIKESSERTRDTMNVTHWLGLAAMIGIAAIFSLAITIAAVYKRINEACGCG